ncbi:MAG TPA: TonB-dependent receptor [Steroidobacteraceae bacterium]
MTYRLRARRLCLAAAVTVLTAALSAYSAPVRADLSAAVNFDIAPQRLPSAVLQYSEQSGVQVTSPAELLSGRRSAGVKGVLPAENALAQLLAGTGLEFAVVDRNTVSIHAGPPAPRETNRSTSDERAMHLAQASAAQAPAGQAAQGPAVSVQPDQSSLQEITVTAQKRSENILTVPISISAVNQAVMDQRGVKDINDLSRLVPGVSLTLPPTSATPESTGVRIVAIRGISATAGSATTGVYVDDTPIQGRESGTLFPELFDLDRVEVLRGPQGTLFGAGSEGGTLRFITPQPSLSQVSAYTRGEVAFTRGGDPTFEVGVAAGGPLVDNKVGVRASLWAREDGGYIDRYNFFTGAETASNTNSISSYAGRFAVLMQATDAFSITPSLMYQRVARSDSDVWWSTAGVFRSFYDIPQPTTEQFYLPSVSLEYDLDAFSVKAITSYYNRFQDGTNRFFHSSKQQLFYPEVPDYTLADHIDKTQNNITEELRLTSKDGGRLTWVAGVFFMDDRETYKEYEYEPLANQLWLALTGYDILDFFGVPLIDNAISYRDSRHDFEKETALFGDASYEIVDHLKLSAGVRVSHTEFGFTEYSDGPFGVGGDLNPIVTSGSTKEHPVTPKVALSYDLGNGVVYASARKGYRIGGANALLPNICSAQLKSLGIDGTAPPYSSDSVWSYELGAKRALADGHVQLAASAFRINWSHIQGVIPLNSCAYTFTGNFGAAVSQGADLQFLYTPVHGLEFGGSLAYTNAHYTETVPVPGDATQLLARNGDWLLNTPRLQGDASASYTWTAWSGVDAYSRIDTSYTGHYYRTYSSGVNGYIGTIRDGKAITDVSLRAGAKFSRWDVSAFINNLTDNSTPLFEDVGTVAGTYGAEAVRSISLRPRTLGFDVTFRY